MTMTPSVHRQFFPESHTGQMQVVRLPPARSPPAQDANVAAADKQRTGKQWTAEEHARFLQGLEIFPHGPWSRVAAFIGTRTTRQTTTHAQKYRQRIARQAQLNSRRRAREQSPSCDVEPMGCDSLENSSGSDCEFFSESHDWKDLDDVDLNILLSLLSTDEDNSGEDDQQRDSFVSSTAAGDFHSQIAESHLADLFLLQDDE